jgi:hypothetical protein
MASVYVYADGRVILQREGGAPGGANKRTSGLLEQRLSPDGVDLLLSEVLSTGLFDHELELLREHGFAGTIQARNGDRLVRVYWENRRPPAQILDPQQYPDTPATPEQERALERLDALLTDPAASLPASAWQDREIRAYVPSRYAVCWGHRPEQSPDQPTPSIPPSRVLNLLPATVADLLRHRGYVPWNGGGPLPPGNPPEACSVVPTEEARTVAQALSAAGLEERGGGEGRGSESLSRLTYRFKAPDARPGHGYIYFEPTLPHGEWTCTPCG